MTWTPIVGAVVALLGAVGGLYGAWSSRRTETRTATREETQQALDAQSALLDRYEARIEGLEAAVKTAMGQHAQCEARLILLERTLTANGLELPPLRP